MTHLIVLRPARSPCTPSARPLLPQPEARQGDVCVRQIQLANSRSRKAGFDFKTATLVLIEQGSKHRWEIEFRVIEKVNRSIHDSRGAHR